MAFSAANLSPIGGQSFRGKAPMVWSYWTTDSLATVDTAGYFDNGETTRTRMRDLLKVGDVILVSVVDSVTTPTAVTDAGTLIVVSNSAGIIDTTDAVSGASKDVYLFGTIADISTAGQIYIVSPVTGVVKAVYGVLNGTIDTADSVLTVKTPAGTVGTITVAYDGSAAGDIDSLTSGLLNTAITKGAAIEIETGGQSGQTISEFITVIVTPSIVDTD